MFGAVQSGRSGAPNSPSLRRRVGKSRTRPLPPLFGSPWSQGHVCRDGLAWREDTEVGRKCVWT